MGWTGSAATLSPHKNPHIARVGVRKQHPGEQLGAQRPELPSSPSFTPDEYAAPFIPLLASFLAMNVVGVTQFSLSLARSSLSVQAPTRGWRRPC